MKAYEVIIEPEAQKDLKSIYDFIVLNDSESKAKKFLTKLQERIFSLEFMPQRHRKSIYIENENVHDMIVQGYTICYAVRTEEVHILAVFRQRVL